MKKIISLFTTFCIVFSVLGTFTVSAEPLSGDCGAEGANVTWTLDDEGVMTISGTGTMENWTPYPVYPPWKSSKDNIKKVVIENGVTSVGDYAFYWCKNLTEVTLPKGITRIGKHAFGTCQTLMIVNIPESTQEIGEYAFSSCYVLQSVNIGVNVTTIGEKAFNYCKALTEINIDNQNQSFSSQDGVLFNKDKTELIQYPMGKSDTQYSVPDTVKKINKFAFNYSSIESINIPEGVTEIGESSFSSCSNLTNANIPEGVISIGKSAFSNCKKLSSDMIIPDSVTYIGEGTFKWCESLPSVHIGKGLTVLENELFYNCKGLANLIISNNITRIGDSAIRSCDSLNSISIPDSVAEIGRYAFAYNSGLTSISIGSGVTKIDDYAFRYCESVPSLIIPDSVTEIGEYAFADLTAVTNIIIGSGITEFSEYAFAYCGSLTELTIPNSVTAISPKTFYDCKNLQSVTIGNSVKSIGYLAFRNCEKLAIVNMPLSVTEISEHAFNSCTGLKDVFYAGSREDWEKITIGNNNDRLLNATIHFANGDPTPSPTPTTTATIIPTPTATSGPTDISNIKLGDYVQMGMYDGKPMIYRVATFQHIEEKNDNNIKYDKYVSPQIFSSTRQNGYYPLLFYVGTKSEIEKNANSGNIMPSKAFSKNGSGYPRADSDRERFGTNYWDDCNLRIWLNSDENTPTYRYVQPDYASEAGFLTNFSSAEKRAILKNVTQKTVISSKDVTTDDTSKDGGTEKHTQNGTVSNAIQNYDDAYYKNSTDTVFVPAIPQILQVYNNLKSAYTVNLVNHPGAYYWLRDAYSDNTKNTRLIWSNGTVVDINAYNPRGVRPMFFLDLSSSAIFESGNGTANNPYQINNSIPTPTPTIEPTSVPTAEPTAKPTVEPTIEPTVEPTIEPTDNPTVSPTVIPTVKPMITPTAMPTVEPTMMPTATPTISPIVTEKPTDKPIETAKPTEEPDTCFVVDNQGTFANITNNGEEQTVAVIIAEYEGETLKSVNVADITFAKAEMRTFMLGNSNYKVFVWNSLKGMVPLSR